MQNVPNNLHEMSKAAQFVLDQLVNAGYESYSAGGCVRDSLLGRLPHDFDIATNATPEQVAQVFPGNAEFVGKHFGVSLVKLYGFQFEVATFRADGVYLDGRHPESVTLTLSAEEDAQRRDFTMNALFMNVDGCVVDFVNGQEDLKNKLVRAVGDPNNRFQEDALRMLRAVRFCCQLGFTLDPATEFALVQNAHLVQQVSEERVAVELEKMLTSGRADLAFDLLVKTGLAKYVMPELLDMVGCEHNSPEYHPEGDVANHTKLLLKNLPQPCTLTLALSALLHDVGKPKTRVVGEKRTSFHHHQDVGAVMSEEILRRLKFSSDVIETVVCYVKNHMKFFNVQMMKKSTLMRFVKTPNFSELKQLAKLDVLASNNNFTDLDFLEKFLEENASALNAVRLVTGNDFVALGFKPGPNFKVMLDAVETEQYEGRVSTRDEALNFVKAKFNASS